MNLDDDDDDDGDLACINIYIVFFDTVTPVGV
jgi:hypothetical protein